MTTYLFLGPSVPLNIRQECSNWACVLPPVAGGDLLRLPVQPGDTVGIVDGFFQRRPAVRHKEILHLLDGGVAVHGAASMGALRAAELALFGMVGHGRIYRDYASSRIVADDEVALLHGTEEEDFQPYTEALINIRYALEDTAARGILSAENVDQILIAAGTLPFTERTRPAILDIVRTVVPEASVFSRVQGLLGSYPDTKRADALNLLASLNQSHTPAPSTTGNADVLADVPPRISVAVREPASSPRETRRSPRVTSVEPAMSVPPGAGGDHVGGWVLHRTRYLQSWQAAARGEEHSRYGWIREAQLHEMAAILAPDYPRFREQTALAALATEHAISRNLIPAPIPALVDSTLESNLAAQRAARQVEAVRLLRPHLGLAPDVPDEIVQRSAVLERLRDLGILGINSEANQALDRWCTSTEKHLPPARRASTAAARMLYTDLAWDNPFLDALKTIGALPRIRSRFLQYLRFEEALHRKMARTRTHQPHIKDVADHFARRWHPVDLQDAAIERGFPDLLAFVQQARHYYQFDRLRTDLPALLIFPPGAIRLDTGVRMSERQ